MAVTGPPYYFWVNRDEPFFVGSMQTASSGRVAIVRNASTNVGRPMRVNFRMMTRTQLQALGAQTGVFTILTKSVVWSFNNPLTYDNEVIKESDSGYSNDATVLDYYRGTMNLIIVA